MQKYFSASTSSPASRCWLAALAATVALTFAAAMAAAATTTDQIYPSFTNNRLGAGTNIRFRVLTTQSDGGITPQTEGVTTFIPKGLGVHTRGFPTCARQTLESRGPSACPRGAFAGPQGIGHAVVMLGEEAVREPASIQPINGGVQNGHITLMFYVNGTSPVSVQLVLVGSLEPYDMGPYGQKLVVPIPPIPTLPGAPDASITDFTVTVGTTIRRSGKTIYNITVPRHCPRGGFPWGFQANDVGGLIVSATAKSPCPRR